MSESVGTGVGDTGAQDVPGAAAEPRWPMAAAVIAATILYVGMPHRGRIPGWWLGPVLQLLLLGLLIAPDPGRIDSASVTLRRLMVALLVVMTAGTLLASSSWPTTSWSPSRASPPPYCSAAAPRSGSRT
jgi:hypothetical protein